MMHKGSSPVLGKCRSPRGLHVRECRRFRRLSPVHGRRSAEVATLGDCGVAVGATTGAVVYARLMSRPARPAPRDLVDEWPELASTDPLGEIARRFAVNMQAAIGDRSVRAAARDVGVDHSTILSVLNGRSWPDLATIARLEVGFGVDLWPGRLKQ